MTNKKDLLVVILATFCLTATLFLTVSTRSETPAGTYDPASDINGDGAINILDAIRLSNHFVTSGTPTNWTALLDLQSQMDELNDTLFELQSSVNRLNDSLSLRIQSLEAQIAILNTAIVSLEASNVALMDRMNALETNYSLPFNMSYTDVHSFTTETADYIDMPYMSVTLTLNRTSQLLIMFCTSAWMSSATVNEDAFIICRAVVNGATVNPDAIELTPTENTMLGSGLTHAHRILDGVYTVNFYVDSLSPGTYTIKIQWYISSQGQGDVSSRTLEVIALPV